MLLSPDSTTDTTPPRVPRRPPNRRCIRLPLPAELTAPRLARQVVRDACATWGLENLADAAALVVTEMTTNAVLHAHAPITLTATQSETDLTITLADGDSRLPQADQTLASREHGNGITLIGAMADEWGAYRDAVGKTVWARFSLHGPSG
jgi:anti-sigma regulatory factor (Ser/Thr protein kinase)